MTPTRMAALAAVALLAVLAGGCRRADDRAADTLTQRERDSAIGASRLPGAGAVRGAMKAADSIEARNAALDSL